MIVLCCTFLALNVISLSCWAYVLIRYWNNPKGFRQ